jgi:type IV secretory pathway protease TraF
MNHQAIYNTHPAVKRIADVEGGVVAYDADGNEVTLDADAVAAETITVDNARNLASLRSQRNQLLAETDYLALADHTLSADMTAYRQALRDLPSNTTDPANPVWPTKPGGSS